MEKQELSGRVGTQYSKLLLIYIFWLNDELIARIALHQLSYNGHSGSVT
jgi:hypothetical protein